MNDKDKVQLDIVLEALSAKLSENNIRIFFFIFDEKTLQYMLSGTLCPGCVFETLKSLEEEDKLPPHYHEVDNPNEKVH